MDGAVVITDPQAQTRTVLSARGSCSSSRGKGRSSSRSSGSRSARTRSTDSRSSSRKGGHSSRPSSRKSRASSRSAPRVIEHYKEEPVVIKSFQDLLMGGGQAFHPPQMKHIHKHAWHKRNGWEDQENGTCNTTPPPHQPPPSEPSVEIEPSSVSEPMWQERREVLQMKARALKLAAKERGKPAGAPKRNYNQLMDLLRLEHATQGATKVDQQHDPDTAKGFSRDWNGTHNWTKPAIPSKPRQSSRYTHTVAPPKVRKNVWLTSSEHGPPEYSKPASFPDNRRQRAAKKEVSERRVLAGYDKEDEIKQHREDMRVEMYAKQLRKYNEAAKRKEKSNMEAEKKFSGNNQRVVAPREPNLTEHQRMGSDLYFNRTSASPIFRPRDMFRPKPK